jgi:adenine deaminase
MLTAPCKAQLWECNKTLIDVAQGRTPADVVIRHAALVNVCSHEVLPQTDIAIAEGRVAYLGLAPHTAEHCIGSETKVIDAAGAYVAPGFLDGHMHVESSMVGVAEFARAVVPHGTVGVFYDPHECANVSGLDGVRQMELDATRVPLKAMLTTPSCVPAVPGFEDTGSAIGPDDVAKTMRWDSVVGLGEMMNYPGVLAADDHPLGEIDETLRRGYRVTGHYSVPEVDRGLNAYIDSGVSCCHESARPEDVIAKLRLGMYVQLREGSAWNNLATLAPAISGPDADPTLDTRHCCLVTDDDHPATIVHHGHLDQVLALAVSLGIDAVTAIQMVTINTASCFDLEADLGSIAPGKCADLVFLDDLTSFHVSLTMIDGDVVAKDGAALFSPEPFAYPTWMTHTMHLGERITPATFAIPAPEGAGASVRVRAMGMSAGSTLTRELHLDAPVRNGLIEADPANDLLKVFVFERHHATGTHAAGFVHGFGIHGALAQTVAHDAHNLLVMGDNDADMALAATTLEDCGGGEVAVADGHVLGLVELPVCGLMSQGSAAEVADQVSHMEQVWRDMGCTMNSPFMTLGLASLACIPELRLTDRGYVDCTTYRFVPLLVDEKDAAPDTIA